MGIPPRKLLAFDNARFAQQFHFHGARGPRTLLQTAICTYTYNHLAIEFVIITHTYYDYEHQCPSHTVFSQWLQQLWVRIALKPWLFTMTTVIRNQNCYEPPVFSQWLQRLEDKMNQNTVFAQWLHWLWYINKSEHGFLGSIAVHCLQGPRSLKPLWTL